MRKILFWIFLLGMSATYADTAIFAGGCFWCMQSDFDKLKGVLKTEAGYAGGIVSNPTYELVSTGTSGYSEAVRVTFDPQVINYGQVLNY